MTGNVLCNFKMVDTVYAYLVKVSILFVFSSAITLMIESIEFCQTFVYFLHIVHMPLHCCVILEYRVENSFSYLLYSLLNIKRSTQPLWQTGEQPHE